MVNVNEVRAEEVPVADVKLPLHRGLMSCRGRFALGEFVNDFFLLLDDFTRERFAAGELEGVVVLDAHLHHAFGPEGLRAVEEDKSEQAEDHEQSKAQSHRGHPYEQFARGPQGWGVG